LHSNQMLAVFEDRGISPDNVIVSNVELSNGIHAKLPWIKASGSGIFEFESGFELDLKIEISDVQGRLVQQKNQLNLENGRLTISGLPMGFYVLRAQCDGQTEILRFVVGP
jgi:hypothetical protein